MKRMVLLFTMLCLLLMGCTNISQQPETMSEEENRTKEAVEESLEDSGLGGNGETSSEKEAATELSPEELLEQYLNNPIILDTPVREYGSEIGYIQLEEDLVARILYPEGEITELNNEITHWINDIVAEYKIESQGSSVNGDTAELTAEYDSYLVEEDIVSVKITGIYDKPYLAHPIDIIKTFHASVKTGQLLALDELLSETGREALEKMVVEEAGVEAELVDEAILDHWTLTEKGLEIILERGDYLPMSAGTVTLQYTYDRLEGILTLSKEGLGEETEKVEEKKEALTKKEEKEEGTEEDRQEEVSEEYASQEEVPQKGTPEAVVPKGQPEEEKKMVALTFDDGPSKHTGRLLDIFASHGGKGTFFVVGNVLEGRAETLQHMVGEGHEIAGHSWNHRQLTKLSAEELTDQIMTTRAKIYEITGVDSTLIRPPYGSYNEETKSVCANLGIIMANWSLDTLDWKYKDANRIYNTIMNDVKNGDIILCHDLHGTTVDAMERVIPDLLAQGYQLVTVTELLSQSGKEIRAGEVYNKQ